MIHPFLFSFYLMQRGWFTAAFMLLSVHTAQKVPGRSLIYDDTTRRAFLGIRRFSIPVRATALRLSIMNLMACFRRAVMRGALA